MYNGIQSVNKTNCYAHNVIQIKNARNIVLKI